MHFIISTPDVLPCDVMQIEDHFFETEDDQNRRVCVQRGPLPVDVCEVLSYRAEYLSKGEEAFFS